MLLLTCVFAGSAVCTVLLLSPNPDERITCYRCVFCITSVEVDAFFWSTPSTDRQRPPRGRGGRHSLAAARSRPVCWCRRADTCSVSRQSASCFCTGQKSSDQTGCDPTVWSGWTLHQLKPLPLVDLTTFIYQKMVAKQLWFKRVSKGHFRQCCI